MTGDRERIENKSQGVGEERPVRPIWNELSFYAFSGQVRVVWGRVVTNREFYQRKAGDLVRRSRSLRDPLERKKVLELAFGYLALARYVGDRRDHATAHRTAEHDPAHYLDDA